MDIAIRFVVGGLIVSLFSLLGGLFRPIGFAGLFGAAPSVALATLSLVIAKEGQTYASVECRSMIAGAVALTLYTLTVVQLLMKFRLSPVLSTLSSTLVWFLAAFALWQVFL
jgi:uncharacterized membrane protein (GlpM family)